MQSYYNMGTLHICFHHKVSVFTFYLFSHIITSCLKLLLSKHFPISKKYSIIFSVNILHLQIQNFDTDYVTNNFALIFSDIAIQKTSCQIQFAFLYRSSDIINSYRFFIIMKIKSIMVYSLKNLNTYHCWTFN